MKPGLVHYPWPSVLMALLLIAWQCLLLHPEILSKPGILQAIPSEKLPIGLAIMLMLAGYDFWRFHRALQRGRDQLKHYQDQINELFDAKRQLGTRARTYSDHADKLKMFISERLLEYIEYDEKFLHFKNIASEVRHNGVISYDKAQTALQAAALHCESPDEKQRYLEASDSLLYLWDLLDLSTTDNIALHVTNRIYDCEEHYFQNLLKDPSAEASPFKPTFMMSHALRRAILPVSENPGEITPEDWKCPGRYQDSKFSVELRSDHEMLGHENHMVLLIENLINNALFYSRQKPHKSRFSKVRIKLAQQAGSVVLSVYNRGPHIDDQEKDKIYQLGFSSRRIREHHGKGLGLYFVDQIVRGFEGSIDFENIRNRNHRLNLSIKLSNGVVCQRELQIVVVDGLLRCQAGGESEESSMRMEWSFEAAISSIEVSDGSARKPQLIAELTADQKNEFIDDAAETLPRWMIEVKNRKRVSTLVVQPLDLTGVEFSVRLPSAKSRLDNPD